MKASDLRSLLALIVACALAGCARSPAPAPQQAGGLAAQAVLQSAASPGTCLIITSAGANEGLQAQATELSQALTAAGWTVAGPVSPAAAAGGSGEFVAPPGGTALLQAVAPHREVAAVVYLAGRPPVEDPAALAWLKARATLVVANLFAHQAEELRPLLPKATLIVTTGEGFALAP